ncbi:SpoIIE family protein phosphatase [Nonomuraea phyllanthi]|uniref:SpoIIE family protein phosphatase n=1 Tax=Nonomuraea phyllanthi TaxID=2219224 RepID=UPI00129374BE|nr:SpoIIE family protein phosphatase [Nonomuraea phyllanthi]QFY10518.1 SpoIIE family protein phosphatase [Nonomuraea phyllanthi]
MASSGTRFPAIIVIDAGGTVIAWSRAAEELFGYHAAELLGRPGSLVLPGNLPPGDQEQWYDLVEARHRDGGTLLVGVAGSRLTPLHASAAWLLSVTPATDEGFRRAAGVLEPIIDHSPVAMALWDRDLRCVWLNNGARRLRSVFPHYEIGRSLAEPLPGTDTEAAQEVMREVLADGTAMIDLEELFVSADQSEERILSTSLFRLDGVDGRPWGVCSVALDVTDSRARRRLTLLREASIRIGTTLNVQKTAQELADLAVPALADYVTVDLAEAVLPADEPLQRLAATDVSIPVFRRAGVASIHEGIPESLWPLGEPVFVPPSSPFTKVLTTGRSHFERVLDTSPGTWLDQDPDRAEIIHGTGMHTLIIVPLRARGEILGITVFVRTDNEAPFTKDDLLLAEELGARAALSLDNARRYTRERTAALALQRNLLPRRLTGSAALEVTSRYLPAGLHDAVGGDWFDAIPLPRDRVALVVGDVTGHGINAAATMGRLRTAVRTLTYMGLPPDELLAHLDDLVVRLTEEDAGPDGFPLDPTGATCLYAVYDPATRRFTMAGAGHPPPALVTPSGEVRFPRPPSGTPIGLGLGAYRSLDLELAEGTLIALYTDGLIETRTADIEAGIDRLGAALAQATLPLEDFCSTVIRAMVGEEHAEDDIALLVARTRVP